jgi:hypothetical protein
MNPEHRSCSGHPVGFQVQIRYGRRRLHSARGCDPSSDGVYIEVRAVTLPDGTPVELEIEAGGRHWVVQAVVAHRDVCGIVARFLDPQPELVADLARAEALPMPLPAPAPVRAPLLERTWH